MQYLLKIISYDENFIAVLPIKFTYRNCHLTLLIVLKIMHIWFQYGNAIFILYDNKISRSMLFRIVYKCQLLPLNIINDIYTFCFGYFIALFSGHFPLLKENYYF